MRSSFFATHPRIRATVPWALWGIAASVGIPLAMSYSGFGSSPAEIESRVVKVAPMRTAHRLRIAKILVTAGQPVKTGDLLVQMDTSEVDADLAIARARLAYTEVSAGWDQIRMLDDRARTSHELATTAERAAVEAARIVADAEHDRSELAQLDINLAAEQRLVSDQLANTERLRSMRQTRAALAKKVEELRDAVAQARRSVSGSSRRLGEWDRDVKYSRGASSGVPAVPGDIRAAAIELQRQEIARLENDRRLHEVRAPFAGRIGQVLMQVGDLSADPDAPIVTLVEELTTTAIAYLAQNDAQKVRVGDIARLVPRDLSGAPLTGRVTALAPNIGEIPVRFRHVPNLHEFGRYVYIRLDAPASLPGRAFEAVFRRGSGGGA